MNEKQETRKQHTSLRGIIIVLAAAGALAVLAAIFFAPVLQVIGSSMDPALPEGSCVVSVKTSNVKAGQVVAFDYNNKILVKRIIATEGEWIDIDKDGTVTVNSQILTEPYVSDPSMGECDIDFPYQVPEGKVFVMGDKRSRSIDSRSSAVGCIGEDQLIGKIVFCVWPFGNFGIVH